MEGKTKRVGLFSMGLVLIILGITILLSQFTRIDIIGLSLKLWPMVLILLGLEVLWMNYRNNSDENIRIKFDLASIFIVILILIVNLGLYGIYETGIIDHIRQGNNMKSFSLNEIGKYK